MKCADCGAENPDGNVYCGKCGVALPSPDSDIYWSKQYGPQDFGERVVRKPDGVYVETDYSTAGWRERTTYPRWMVVLPIALGLAVLFVATLFLFSMGIKESSTLYMESGLVTLGITTLIVLILYWIYYRPPEGATESERRMRDVRGDVPDMDPTEMESDYHEGAHTREESPPLRQQ
jgi:hypothetical protein